MALPLGTKKTLYLASIKKLSAGVYSYTSSHTGLLQNYERLLQIRFLSHKEGIVALEPQTSLVIYAKMC